MIKTNIKVKKKGGINNMEKKDLIEKLENMVVPEIELQTHKQRLKLSLLIFGEKLKKSTIKRTQLWLKRLIISGIGVFIIVAIMIFAYFEPKYQIAKALEIIKNNIQLQETIKEYNLEIKDIKVKDEKAYVLLTIKEGNIPEPPTYSKLSTHSIILYQVDINGNNQYNSFIMNMLVIIDLKGKRVETINSNIFSSTLTNDEEKQAIEIAKNYPIVQNFIIKFPKYITEVKYLPPSELYLDEENGVIIAKPKEGADKFAIVIFTFINHESTDNESCEIKVIVNLTKKQVSEPGPIILTNQEIDLKPIP
jgi:hypothetical protein